MELAKPETQDAPLRHAANATAVGSLPGGEAEAVGTGGKAPKSPRPRCRCGRCARCADDARWERIFAEKFEDPYYYTSHLVRFSSTLE